MSTKLSRPQRMMLIGIRDHDNPYQYVHGLSAHGGAGQTFDSLVRRGLIEADSRSNARLTEAGCTALAENS